MFLMQTTPPTPENTRKAALIGRPNVGKSTLFNRLIRSNRAITHDRPGVTRDRMEGVVRRRGEEEFLLVDTGGVTLDSHARVQEGPEGIRGFEAAILEQAREAVGESDLVCLVVDGKEGLSPLDAHLADFLRKADKPLLLVVNKIDGPERQDILLAEFHGLGLEMLPCSAAHGYNVRELEDYIRERLYPQEVEDDIDAEDDSVLFAGASRRQKKRLLEGMRQERAETAVQTERKERDGRKESGRATVPAAPDDGGAPAGYDDNGYDDNGRESGEPESVGRKDGNEAARASGTSGAEEFIGVDGEVYRAGAEDALDDNGEQHDWAADREDLGSGPLRLAMLGRPNAGKSSLVNALVGGTRMIVSDIAGTTRDSVDVSVDVDGERITFVDTAGVRRRAKITDTVERYSVNSSLKSTTKAHVTLLVLDASEGLTQQDKRLIDLLNERKTPFMVLINKSDLIEPKLRREAEKRYKEAMVFCPHVPLLFVSALNRHNLKKIVPLAREIRRECGVRIPTGQLNRAMAAVLERHQPPIVRNVRAKFFYLTQAESLPPTFVFFVNDAERVKDSYIRYLERSLRKMFGIRHAPMRVNFRSSHSKKAKKR